MSAAEPSRNFERWLERHLCVPDGGRPVQVFELRSRDGGSDGDLWDSWHIDQGVKPSFAVKLASEIEEALDTLSLELPTRRHSFVVLAMAQSSGGDLVEVGRKILTKIGKNAKSNLNASGQDPLTSGVDAIVATTKNLLATVNQQLDQQRQLIDMQNSALGGMLRGQLNEKLQELQDVAETTQGIAMAGAKFEAMLEKWGPEIMSMVGDYLSKKE